MLGGLPLPQTASSRFPSPETAILTGAGFASLFSLRIAGRCVSAATTVQACGVPRKGPGASRRSFNRFIAAVSRPFLSNSSRRLGRQLHVLSNTRRGHSRPLTHAPGMTVCAYRICTYTIRIVSPLHLTCTLFYGKFADVSSLRWLLHYRALSVNIHRVRSRMA